MPQTNKEKQRLLRERRDKKGLIRREYWGTVAQHKAIKTLLNVDAGESKGILKNKCAK